MPRLILPEIQEKLNDKNWLNDQHVIQLLSITSISKQLKVTPATVSKALHKANIISPSQQTLREAANRRKYGVSNPGAVPEFRNKALATMNAKNGGHPWSNANRARRDKTCLARYGNTNVGKTEYSKQKSRETKLGKHTCDSLTSVQWIEQQYYFNNKSIGEISKELNVAWSTVAAAFHRLGIEVKQSTIPVDALNCLTSYDWLCYHHHTCKKPLTTIAAELKVSVSAVYRYAGAVNLDIKLYSSLSSEIIKLLEDEQWLRRRYIHEQQTFSEIARGLDVSSCTVAEYCKKHNIENQQYTHKIAGDVFQKLNSKDWMLNQHTVQQKSMVRIANDLGFKHDMTTVMRYMHHHNIPILQFRHSAGEKQVVQMLKDASVTNIVENIKSIISPHELDIYLPNHNLAIEYCGLYWHGEQFKPRLYHRNKTTACNKLGIRLLTIYENEWACQPDTVKQKLLSILKFKNQPTIFARKCTAVELAPLQKKQFLDKHHIQQDGPGSITYGLLYQNSIVAVITFIKSKNNEYVLNRYASSCNIPGGFSKLLSHFKKHNTWNKITTFADLRWSEGALYEKTGFVLDKILEPDYQYIINNQPVHKFNFRRKYLSIKLKKFDPDLSEWENCKRNNIDRIWDCGKKRYVMNNNLH